jgi:uncharacterized protein (DUF983 family)
MSETGDRNRWTAMKRGFMGHCPNCDKGRIFCGYLKVNATCPNCGEQLHHHRADDAPPYFTILIVGHVIGALMLWVEEYNDSLPIWLHAIVWPVLTIVLSLLLLPRIKGALIGLQWALRMHGFGDEKIAALPSAGAA